MIYISIYPNEYKLHIILKLIIEKEIVSNLKMGSIELFSVLNARLNCS